MCSTFEPHSQHPQGKEESPYAAPDTKSSFPKVNRRELREVTERFQKGSSSTCSATASARLLFASKHLHMLLWSMPCTYLFHIISCFSTGFNIHHIQFLGFSLTLLYRNLSTATRTNHRKEKPKKNSPKMIKRKLQEKASHQLKQH